MKGNPEHLWKITIGISEVAEISKKKGAFMTVSTILMVVLVLALLGALPTWGYSNNWGYGPSGGVGLLLIVLVLLMFTGHI